MIKRLAEIASELEKDSYTEEAAMLDHALDQLQSDSTEQPSTETGIPDAMDVLTNFIKNVLDVSALKGIDTPESILNPENQNTLNEAINSVLSQS